MNWFEKRKKMSEIFYSRTGKAKYADDVIPTKQKGYFAVLLKDDKVLVTYPPQVNIPEFPGGTISRKEELRDCLYRKLYEETGLDFMLSHGVKEYNQVINYFAEDAKPEGVYCIYDQTFIVYDASLYGFDTNIEEWRTPENGRAVWVSIKDIISGEFDINYIHKQAFLQLL